MRSAAVAAAALALAARAFAGGGPFDPAQADGAKALAETERFVALGPRESGSDGARRAAEYLRGRLRELGVAAETDEFRDAVPGGTAVFRNVVGRREGTGRGLVILASHYDTKAGLGPGFAGANDSGSSTGLLLDLARVARAAPPGGPEVWFAFFDGEESRVAYGPRDGLHGSRRMARRLVETGRARDVRGVVLLDMVGDRDLTVTIPRNSTPRLVSLVFEAARAEGARNRFALSDWSFTDDHEPFLERGMPAVDLIDFEYGSAPGRNDYWHTPADTLDKLSAASLQVVGRVALRVANRLAGSP